MGQRSLRCQGPDLYVLLTPDLFASRDDSCCIAARTAGEICPPLDSRPATLDRGSDATFGCGGAALCPPRAAHRRPMPRPAVLVQTQTGGGTIVAESITTLAQHRPVLRRLVDSTRAPRCRAGERRARPLRLGAEHPLPIRCERQDPVHQVSRGVVHPPRHAGRTPPAAHAAGPDELLLPAAAARDACEAPRKAPTRLVLAKLPLQEAGQPVPLAVGPGFREQRLQVLAHHGVEQRLLRPPRRIAARAAPSRVAAFGRVSRGAPSLCSQNAPLATRPGAATRDRPPSESGSQRAPCQAARWRSRLG